MGWQYLRRVFAQPEVDLMWFLVSFHVSVQHNVRCPCDMHQCEQSCSRFMCMYTHQIIVAEICNCDIYVWQMHHAEPKFFTPCGNSNKVAVTFDKRKPQYADLVTSYCHSWETESHFVMTKAIVKASLNLIMLNTPERSLSPSKCNRMTCTSGRLAHLSPIGTRHKFQTSDSPREMRNIATVPRNLDQDQVPLTVEAHNRQSTPFTWHTYSANVTHISASLRIWVAQHLNSEESNVQYMWYSSKFAQECSCVCKAAIKIDDFSKAGVRNPKLRNCKSNNVGHQ